MATIDEQIKSLEEEIGKTQKNKATNAHIGKLKAKIAALRARKEKAQAHAKASGGGPGFEVRKSGDASVALVGFPSVGKSSLISQLTEVESEVGNFAFTTLTCIPGLMEHKGAKIQILDLPGLIKGAAEGKGRGKEILNVIRGADMVLYVLDPFQESHFDILDLELWRSGMRLNQDKPQVFITRSNKGGIVVRSTVKQTNLTHEEIQEIVRSFGIVSATVTLRTDVTDDHIVDTLAGNRVYSNAVVVINKVDLANEDDIQRTMEMIPHGWPVLEVSAKTGIGIENMKDFVLVGQTFGRVRALFNEFGKPVNTAGPSTPVVITGLSATPNVGDQLISTDDEKKVREIASTREKKQKEIDMQSKQKNFSIESFGDAIGSKKL